MIIRIRIALPVYPSIHPIPNQTKHKDILPCLPFQRSRSVKSIVIFLYL